MNDSVINFEIVNNRLNVNGQKVILRYLNSAGEVNLIWFHQIKMRLFYSIERWN